MQFPINYIKKVEITMKKYIKPYMDITELEEDIITSSGESPQGQAEGGEGQQAYDSKCAEAREAVRRRQGYGG